MKQTTITERDGKLSISTNQYKWINRIKALKSSYPDQVTISAYDDPKLNDTIFATLPIDWLRIKPPKTINLSDQQKHDIAERLRNARKNT